MIKATFLAPNRKRKPLFFVSIWVVLIGILTLIAFCITAGERSMCQGWGRKHNTLVELVDDQTCMAKIGVGPHGDNTVSAWLYMKKDDFLKFQRYIPDAAASTNVPYDPTNI